MTHLEEKQRILKVDGRGRVQTRPEQREALLDEFERSGLSGKRFAEMVGVLPLTFSSWICQRRRKRAKEKITTGRIEPVVLLEAVLDSPPQQLHPVMVVELGGGAKVEVRNREQLVLVAELLGLLSGAKMQSSRGC